jgi:hypothetical protein
MAAKKKAAKSKAAKPRATKSRAAISPEARERIAAAVKPGTGTYAANGGNGIIESQESRP